MNETSNTTASFDEVYAAIPGRYFSPYSPDYLLKNEKTAVKPLMVNPLPSRSYFEQRLKKAKEAAKTGKKGKISGVPSEILLSIGGLVATGDWQNAEKFLEEVIRYITKAAKTPGIDIKSPNTRQTYGFFAKRLLEIVKRINAGDAPGYQDGREFVPLYQHIGTYSLSRKGNVKLPFCAYSEMPVVTCPGAGGVPSLPTVHHGFANPQNPPDPEGCAAFCYSFNAFPYPTVFFNWCMNTLGFTYNPKKHVETVCTLMQRLKSKHSIMRLFVDGDFRSVDAIVAWMEGLKTYLPPESGVMIYGYTKSFAEFLEVNRRYNQDGKFWPKNYLVNLSSGNRHAPELMQRMREELGMHKGGPVRGAFVAVEDLQRLCWKIFGKEAGENRYREFVLSTKGLARHSKAHNAKLKEFLDEVRRAAEFIGKEDIYEKYIRATEIMQRIEADVAAYNKAAPAGLRLSPGQVRQAVNWKLLLHLREDNEFSCPIDCGNCPAPAIKQHDKVIEALIAHDFITVQSILAQKDARAEYEETGVKKAMHACGNSQIDKDIIIGKH